MKLIKKFAATAATTAVMAFASTAQALPVTVLGVTFDPAVNPFTSQTVNMRQMIDPATGMLTVFGIITVINSQGTSSFCASGCELTFTGTGFTPNGGGTPVPGAGSVTTYSGGTINLYADSTPNVLNPFDYNSLTFANTSDGDLFLSLNQNDVLTGTVDGAGAALSGLGLLNVTGGAAAAYFDTNSQANGADLRFSTSLTAPIGGTGIQNMAGTGNFFGQTSPLTVPEPGSLALIGLGLVGLFASSRRRKSA